jgi:hypothetical protein
MNYVAIFGTPMMMVASMLAYYVTTVNRTL